MSTGRAVMLDRWSPVRKDQPGTGRTQSFGRTGPRLMPAVWGSFEANLEKNQQTPKLTLNGACNNYKPAGGRGAKRDCPPPHSCIYSSAIQVQS
ncbi:hypothetical protein PCANC_16907 [Puccinia coronata f. sp. avenae]|uniref:Uncharacterized protein n=1 Tax=Puccinia coronata f. sp. avenae TaxID=200324 RepID=A0A2N5SNR7_9BASI|nr:hypothetical protein PCANC_16907 [Puccinia coronata f. sp. avenae]